VQQLHDVKGDRFMRVEEPIEEMPKVTR
jgi:hypothetical protein